MTGFPAIRLFVNDRAVLSSLEFALAVEGFNALDGNAPDFDPASAAALVIDGTSFGEGVATLAALRRAGCMAPAILLATNPRKSERAQARADGVILIDKPLLCDELSSALNAALQIEKAA